MSLQEQQQAKAKSVCEAIRKILLEAYPDKFDRFRVFADNDQSSLRVDLSDGHFVETIVFNNH